MLAVGYPKKRRTALYTRNYVPIKDIRAIQQATGIFNLSLANQLSDFGAARRHFHLC